MSIIIYQNQKRLDDLFKKISELPVEPEIMSHWSKYLCVLVSGFLETSITTVYSNYANNSASQNTANFAQKNLLQFQNAKMEKILSLTGMFSADWREELEIYIEEEIKASIDSIVANRHLIAHGRFVGITFSQISKYYEDAKKLIQKMEHMCKR
jgi:hypothetical protein